MIKINPGGDIAVKFLQQELELSPTDVVEVSLNGQANVMLLDPPNFERYREGSSFRYHGGLAETSPIRLVPPRGGRWHVVVDLGGFTGKVRAGVRVFEDANAVG